jgi:hypothetical protein
MTVLAQTQITDCPDKCVNNTLYQKGTLDPKTRLCVYGIQTPCKYGCEDKIISCKQFPDTPPAPNSTDYSETIWNMVKTILDSQNGTLNTDILNQTFNTVSTMSQKGSISIHGTEYQVGDNATVFLQLLNATNQPINDALCYLTLYYPNKTIFLNNANMMYMLSSAGLYYYDVVAPSATGVYMVSASCDFSYNLTYINSSKDSYVISSLPTANYGNETVFVVGAASSGAVNITSYVQFSNLTLNGNVTSAYLFLYKVSGIGSNLTVNLYRVTSDWNESNITWNNQPTVNGYKYDSKVMNSIGWYSWNITNLLIGWLNGTYTNYGMYLNFTSPALGTWNFSSFSSREYGGGYVPMILVMYDSTEFISEIRGSGELHVSDTLSNLTVNINVTQLNNIFGNLTDIKNYLITINGTTFQINQSLYYDYLSLLEAINSVNFTLNTTIENKIDYLNSTVIPLLELINSTTIQNLILTASINQSLLSDYISLYNLLSSVDGNVQNLNSSEFQHFQDLYVILKDINYTTNSTLEYKLDFINSTAWNTWLLLQNLTIGNVSVSANVNWTEGYLTTSVLSFSDKINNEGIDLFTETLTCLSNSTLQHWFNGTKCIQGVCHAYNETITEFCMNGCANSQCVPAPHVQYAYALGIIFLLAGVIYAVWKAGK